LIKVRGRPVSHAHRASAKWEEEFETLASWFEAGEAVERLLQPLRMRKRRIEAVSTQLLPASLISACHWYRGARLADAARLAPVPARLLQGRTRRAPARQRERQAAWARTLVPSTVTDPPLISHRDQGEQLGDPLRNLTEGHGRGNRECPARRIFGRLLLRRRDHLDDRLRPDVPDAELETEPG
jgi:hypothetical protein